MQKREYENIDCIESYVPTRKKPNDLASVIFLAAAIIATQPPPPTR